MIRVGILGDIGSGKTYVSKRFGYPVFNADEEVDKIYKKDMRTFNKLKKVLEICKINSSKNWDDDFENKAEDEFNEIVKIIEEK